MPRIPFPARMPVTTLMITLVALVIGGPGVVEPAIAAPDPAPAAPDPAPAAPDPAPAAPDPTPASSPDPARFRWPLEGRPPVVRRFEPPPRPWLPGHRGVDLSTDPGAPVHAAGPGVVRFAGQVAGRGVVSIEHADGLRTTYEPVTVRVTDGQEVRAGDVIGTLDGAHPGCPVAACLHWGLRRGDVYLDPLALVGRGRVRLLPLATS